MVSRSPDWDSSVYAADEVTWAKWAGREALELWQLVALHSKVDPDSLGIGSRGAGNTLATVTFFDNLPVHPPMEINHDDPMRRLVNNLDVAAQAVEGGSLKRFVDRYERPDEVKATDPWNAQVAVSDFHAWSIRVSLPMIDGWPLRPNAQEQSGQRRWPWGSHDSKLLRQFADIAEHWRLKSEGGPYDPEDQSTAPKAEMIEPLLEAQGISEKVRQAMFTILSPDGLKPGPRGRKRTPK